MAVAIDTRNLVEKWIPRLEELLFKAEFAKDRYQVHKVYACATVLTQDEEGIKEISNHTPSFSVTQEALDWQQQQDDDLSEGDVYNHLIRMSAVPRTPTPGKKFSSSSNSFPRTDESISFPRFFVTNAESQTFAASAKGRPASSFRRHSFRLSTLEIYDDCLYPGYHVGASTLQEPDTATVRKVPTEWWESMLHDDGPELVWTSPGERSAVLWHVQVDILDMRSIYRPPPSGKRRGRRYGAFLQVPTSSSADERAVSEAKRFKGVRYRPDRGTFVAEAKLPMMKNKDSFGDFKSATEAARAVDAAFLHYGFREKVNFPDSAHILSLQPITPTELNGNDTLSRVRRQAKWLAANFAVSNFSHETATPEPSLSCSAVPGYLPSSALESCDSAGLADCGASQVSMNAIAASSVSGSAWPESSTSEPLGDEALIHDRELGREVDDTLGCASVSLGHFEQQWDFDGSELCITRFVESSGSDKQPAYDGFQDQCVGVDFLWMSSPCPNLFQTESPQGFQDGVAERLLQQQSVCFEDHAAMEDWFL